MLNQHPTAMLKLASVVVLALATAAISGCNERAAVTDVTEATGDQPSTGFGEVDAQLAEVRTLIDSGDSRDVFESTNVLLRRLSQNVEDGAMTSERAVEIARTVDRDIIAAPAIDIDIDIHIGTKEKCDERHNCVEGNKTCISLTWHGDGGGGRNCFNF